MALEIEIVKSGNNTHRVKLSGALDTQTSPQLETRMTEVLEDASARTVQLELHGLTFISSLGLGAIAKIKKAITAKGGLMLTVGAQPQIARVFDIAKMLPKETVFTTRAEADAYLAAIQNQVIEENRQKPGGQ